MKLNGIALFDLHFGHKRTEEMYKEELPMFLEYLKTNGDEIDVLNFNGDYFDRKLSSTEPAIAYAIAFFNEVIEICIEKNIKVRVILGTRSHDLNQYTTLFQHYFERTDLDIKYIPTVQEEEINGIKILYVPEEYPEDNEAYYAEYKAKSYHVMHGHGTWDFVSFIANSESEKVETGTRSAPIFVYDEWESALQNGFALFGHIHKRQHHKNVYYSGSYTAWGFGDASEKGFMTYQIDTEANTWKVEYINNTKAPSYASVSIKGLFRGQDISNLTLEEIQTIINENLTDTDNVKIDLAGLSEDKIKVFKDLFKDNSNVKIEVKKKKATLKEEGEPAIYDTYGYILKRELPLDQTIQRFVKEEYGENFTLERIKEIITE